MNLTELFALLMFIIGLLTLIVEVIRLTFEVTTFFQKQERDNKKRLTATVTSSSGQSFD